MAKQPRIDELLEALRGNDSTERRKAFVLIQTFGNTWTGGEMSGLPAREESGTDADLSRIRLLVPTQEIKAGDRLDPAMLKTAAFPRDQLVDEPRPFRWRPKSNPSTWPSGGWVQAEAERASKSIRYDQMQTDAASINKERHI